MEGEKIEQLIAEAPFPVMLTETNEHYGESLRTGGGLRPTFRYFSRVRGKVFRIKEFFMDWFYTGFPKSMMKTLVHTYGGISSHETADIPWFYGINYKGNDSATFYRSGVTVEIECESGAGWKEFSELIEDMMFPEGLLDKFRDRGFKRRSFLAAGNTGDWWEDKRIGSMIWNDLSMERFNARINHGMRVVSYGRMKSPNGMGLRTAIASDSNFTRTVWYDVLDLSSNLEHGSYDFREGGDLFDVTWDHTVYYRAPSGPCAYQAADSGYLYTVAFSPGFTRKELEEYIPHPKDVMQMMDEIAGFIDV